MNSNTKNSKNKIGIIIPLFVLGLIFIFGGYFGYNKWKERNIPKIHESYFQQLNQKIQENIKKKQEATPNSIQTVKQITVDGFITRNQNLKKTEKSNKDGEKIEEYSYYYRIYPNIMDIVTEIDGKEIVVYVKSEHIKIILENYPVFLSLQNDKMNFTNPKTYKKNLLDENINLNQVISCSEAYELNKK